jgi:hypothetical protein
LDEAVEQRGPVGLAVVAGVVALADQDRQELGAGAEVVVFAASCWYVLQSNWLHHRPA